MNFKDFKNYILADEQYLNKDERTVIVNDYDLENTFNVYMNNKGMYLYNLNSTMYINISPDDILYYTVKQETSDWSLLSYKIYGTTHLAWLLMKLNSVTAKNVFNTILPGMTIRCLSKNMMLKVINSL